MKIQIQNSERGSRSAEQPYGVNYTWADSKGRMHLSRSVGSGRDRAHAERRFFRQHRHVMSEDGSADIWLCFIVVAVVGLVMLADLTGLRNQMRAANERIDHLQFEVKTLTKTAGEIHHDSMVESNALASAITNLASTGGAK